MDEMVRPRGAWHEGERAAQERVGVAARLTDHGERVLRPLMPDQHRIFFAQLPFIVVGSVDDDRQPFASIVLGQPGFVLSPDPTTLVVRALPDAQDPLAAALREGASLGLLGIELPTLRRNRMNGRVIAVGPGGFGLGVDQSFGNCPQYIHRRDYVGFAPGALAGPKRVEAFAGIDAEAAPLLARADTAFIASATKERGDPSHGVDVSHRGGVPGFLGHDGEGRIILPDYRGNFYFNTLGNLVDNPRVGLTVVDFVHGDLLQLTGRAEIIWEGEALAAHPGAQRLCRIEPLYGQWLRGGFPLVTALREVSPQARAVAERPIG